MEAQSHSVRVEELLEPIHRRRRHCCRPSDGCRTGGLRDPERGEFREGDESESLVGCERVVGDVVCDGLQDVLQMGLVFCSQPSATIEERVETKRTRRVEDWLHADGTDGEEERKVGTS